MEFDVLKEQNRVKQLRKKKKNYQVRIGKEMRWNAEDRLLGWVTQKLLRR